MSIAHAFYCVMFFLGCCSVAYFIGSVWRFRRIGRYQRGWDRITSRWPQHGGHSEHFFRDLKTWPEE